MHYKKLSDYDNQNYTQEFTRYRETYERQEDGTLAQTGLVDVVEMIQSNKPTLIDELFNEYLPDYEEVVTNSVESTVYKANGKKSDLMDLCNAIDEKLDLDKAVADANSKISDIKNKEKEKKDEKKKTVEDKE